MKAKTSARNTAAKIATKLLRADIIEAKTIHLVTDTKIGRKVNLSITTDSRGYPMIRMGDVAGNQKGVTKQVEIGFEVSGTEHWPYMRLSVNRGKWQCSTISVVDRLHEGKWETYPQSSMHHAGRIRTYFRLKPGAGKPWLELREESGEGYFLSSDGPHPRSTVGR